MIRLTWRQHRLQLAVGAVLLVVIAAYLAVGGIQHDSYANSLGLFACIANHPSDCGGLAQAFFEHFGSVPSVFGLFFAVPLLTGLFWGAPLVAHEVETGTHRLAWTQSVTRRHWLTVKLVAFLAATVIGGVVVSLSFNWWLNVANKLNDIGAASINRLGTPEFDFTGIVPVGAALFAFALGVAAGAVIRRTIPAMAVTLGLYFGVTVPFLELRYHLFTPITISGLFGQTAPTQAGSYVLSNGYADAAGHPVSFSQLIGACGWPGAGGASERTTVACLASHGYRTTETYLPGSDYWPMQFIEAGSLIILAAVLLVVGVWWTTRRTS